MRVKHCGLLFICAALSLAVVRTEATNESQPASGMDLATLNVHPETKMWADPTWRGRSAGEEIETGKVEGLNPRHDMKLRLKTCRAR